MVSPKSTVAVSTLLEILEYVNSCKEAPVQKEVSTLLEILAREAQVAVGRGEAEGCGVSTLLEILGNGTPSASPTF